VRQTSAENLISVVLAVVAFVVGAVFLKSEFGRRLNASTSRAASPTSDSTPPGATLELSPTQLNAIKIEPVGKYLFPVEKETVGNISFADDLSVQVFPPYQGKILQSLVELGDQVKRGQPLYTIESPDLIQAESTLIGAAATQELTTKELKRAKELNGTNGVSERELEQATSDEQTAEGALRAARDSVRVFGKSEAEIDQIIRSRRIDPALVVGSPIAGQITAFSGPPGLFVQPGNSPAPYTVADVFIKWMLADVLESDMPLFHVGEPVAVKVMAYPDHVFRGEVSKIYASVDPNSHRGTIRSEIRDPQNELRPGMLANFAIRVRDPIESTAIPANGVVREGDGTMTAWVTTDRHLFSQRTIKAGLRSGGQVQILEGLERGELVVSDGAVFLSNMLEAPPSD